MTHQVPKEGRDATPGERQCVNVLAERRENGCDGVTLTAVFYAVCV